MGGDLGTRDGGEGGGPVGLHPRILERREEIRREEGRRRRHVVLWFVVPLAVAVALFGVAHTPLLAVADIRVEGAGQTSTEEVLEAAGIGTGRPMLTLDESGIERRVEALPWVDEVSVVRRWPRTVRIGVTERVPAAAVSVEGSNIVAWVDAGGRVLQLAGAPPEGLVVVTGLEELPDEGAELPAEVRDALAVAVAAPGRVPGALETVSTDLVGVLAAGSPAPGVAVHFRSGDAVDEKLVALDTILTSADLSCAATVDLWVPDKPTVRRHADCP